MCLVLAVEAPATARAALEATARTLPTTALRIDVEPLSRRHLRRDTTSTVRATISEAGGCACSLLADDAGWNAPYWSMRPEVLEPLVRTLEAIGEAVPEGFAVAALWVGEAANQEQTVVLEGLTALMRAGRLGTRSRYRVPPR
jgi:hypothetical protein